MGDGEEAGVELLAALEPLDGRVGNTGAATQQLAGRALKGHKEKRFKIWKYFFGELKNVKEAFN